MPPRFGRELLHPLPLGAAGLLALNDHVLKGSGLLPGLVTGKLSDFAGLFAFPVLLFAGLDLLTLGWASGPRRRARVALLLATLTAAVFCAVKLDPGVNAQLSAVVGPMLLDPSDLIALPSAALGALWLSRSRSTDEQRGQLLSLRGALAFVAVAAACLATSAPRLVRSYPAWEIQSLGARRLECAIVDIWVSKSGKQGFGVTLEIMPSGSCRVAVTSARFSAGGQLQASARLPGPLELGQKQHLYLPFAFDNQTLWNDGVHDGELELVLEIGDRRERLVFPMKHVWTGPHRVRERGPSLSPRPALTADASTPSQPRFAEPPPEETPP
jgi:hypothetical protein